MTSPSTESASSLPEVSVRQGRTGIVLFALAMVGLAIALFVGLESARMAREPASESPGAVDGDALVRTSPSAELYIPQASPPLSAAGPAATVARGILFPPTTYIAPPLGTASRVVAPVRVEPLLPPTVYTAPYAPPPIYEQPPAAAPAIVDGAPATQRITPQRIRNLSSTVTQGTLIRAVLESALDSTRPGQARALVSRDVKGFDGTRVLIPRGSRLFGDYGSEATAGQDRIMIRWSRLLLPSGVSIALDSPVADPLGRAGVKAKVNSHLLTRLGNALVDSSASVGSTLLGRRLGSGNQVIVALPGAVQSATPVTAQQVVPTLRVRQGERISVFVAHDLDFAETGL